MNEEVFIKQEADELTQRVADRLGLREEKMKQMEQWEKQTSSHRSVYKLFAYVLSVAACIAIAIVIWPSNEPSLIDELGIERPSMTEFRGESSESVMIEQLIEKKNFDEALKMVAESLEKSDVAIEELESISTDWEDEEEMIYNDELERVKNSELRWTYIYLLLQTDDNKQARKELKRYLKTPQYCEHEQEAKELLSRLK